MPFRVIVDRELERLERRRGLAWERLIEASGCVWRSERLVPQTASADEPATLATLAAARLGAQRAGELVAEIEAAEAAVERHRRAHAS
jgi:hypothetical protein